MHRRRYVRDALFGSMCGASILMMVDLFGPLPLPGARVVAFAVGSALLAIATCLIVVAAVGRPLAIADHEGLRVFGWWGLRPSRAVPWHDVRSVDVRTSREDSAVKSVVVEVATIDRSIHGSMDVRHEDLERFVEYLAEHVPRR